MQDLCHIRQVEANISKLGEMYKQYIADGEAAEVLEWSFGYLVLKTEANYLYIETIYVMPEERQLGRGREMLQAVEQRAKLEGRAGVLSSCSPGRKGSTESMQAMLACGFKLLSSKDDLVYLVKPLGQKGV